MVIESRPGPSHAAQVGLRVLVVVALVAMLLPLAEAVVSTWAGAARHATASILGAGGAVLLAWARRREILAGRPGHGLGGVFVVAVAVLVYVYALRLDVWALAGLAAVVLVGGLVLADRGPRGLRAAAPSLLIALFIVPPPSLAIDFAQSQLTGLVARTSCWILSWFLGSEQVVLRGTDLHFGDAYVSIVDDCSGLGGILIAPPFALLLLLLARVPFGWPWLAILVVSTFLAAFANLVRVVTGALLVERGHAASVEHGVVHELLGVGPLLLGGAVTWWMVHALAAGGRADGAQEAA